MDLIKDDKKVEMDKERKKIIVTRTMVEEFEYSEHENNLKKLEYTITDMEEKMAEYEDLIKALSAGHIRDEVQESIERDEKKAKEEREKAVAK